MQFSQNNPENPYTEKKAKNKPSGYTSCSICSLMIQKTEVIFRGEKIVLKSFVKI